LTGHYQAGVDITVIALSLGHESIQTTHRYIEADMQMKERAISRLDEPATRRITSGEADRLLQFLNSL